MSDEQTPKATFEETSNYIYAPVKGDPNHPHAKKVQELQTLLTYNGNDTGRFYHDVMRRLRIFNA